MDTIKHVLSSEWLHNHLTVCCMGPQFRPWIIVPDAVWPQWSHAILSSSQRSLHSIFEKAHSGQLFPQAGNGPRRLCTIMQIPCRAGGESGGTGPVLEEWVKQGRERGGLGLGGEWRQQGLLLQDPEHPPKPCGQSQKARHRPPQLCAHSDVDPLPSAAVSPGQGSNAHFPQGDLQQYPRSLKIQPLPFWHY